MTVLSPATATAIAKDAAVQNGRTFGNGKLFMDSPLQSPTTSNGGIFISPNYSYCKILNHQYVLEKVNRVSSLGISDKIQNWQKMPSFGATGLKRKKIRLKDPLGPTECLNYSGEIYNFEYFKSY